MIPEQTKKNLQDILKRISNGESVTLNERLLIQKYSDRDQTISSWLNKARKLQQKDLSNDSIDELLNALAIGTSEPMSQFQPEVDDLGEWFTGAPSWLARS